MSKLMISSSMCSSRETPVLRRGATLIAVFWVMAVLGVAIVTSMRMVSYQIEVVDARRGGIEARQQAEKGIAIAANPAVKKWELALLRQKFDDDTGFEVKISPEATAFDINFILQNSDKVFLRLLFKEWGIASQEAAEISDALKDWVDQDDGEEINGAESQYYESEGLLHFPYNRPFYSLDEMRLVRGMNLVEAARPDWRKWFTVWSRVGLDVNFSPPEMVAMAADVDVEEVISFQATIDGVDGIRDTEDDQLYDVSSALDILGVSDPEIQARFSGQAGGESEVQRIESIGFSGGVRRKIVLILRNRGADPEILDRREELVQ